eukprot:gene53317-biopygen43879
MVLLRRVPVGGSKTSIASGALCPAKAPRGLLAAKVVRQQPGTQDPHGGTMNVSRFDEGLEHRNILPYDPVYAEVFAQVQRHVEQRHSGVELVHIGSTAIIGLRGKPMVDIAAITSREDLRAEQQSFEALGFHRRAVWVDRDEKPYVCASVRHDGRVFNVNIHIFIIPIPMSIIVVSFLGIAHFIFIKHHLHRISSASSSLLTPSL